MDAAVTVFAIIEECSLGLKIKRCELFTPSHTITTAWVDVGIIEIQKEGSTSHRDTKTSNTFDTSAEIPVALDKKTEQFMVCDAADAQLVQLWAFDDL